MQFVSIFIGKLIFKLLRLLGRTGSALPGLVIEKLNPNFLPHMLAQLPEGVVVISGTNGKTTTTKITAALLESQGLRVLTNKTGSNFVRGITSVVIDKANWSSELPYDIAVFEQDEAHAVHLARKVPLRGVVVLNVMRDQMDRFGEIDTTKNLLQTTAASAKEFVVLSANDERVSTIQPSEGVTTYWYGHSEALQPEFLTDDQLYHAESAVYHLAATPTAELTAYTDKTATIRVADQTYTFNFALTGGHNALNLTASLAVLAALRPAFDHEAVTRSLSELVPAFGRGEVIQLPSGGSLTIQLIKNPGGFTQALRVLKLKQFSTVGIAINDDYADGRDVSWLWDVDFRAIKSPVLCGGDRAADMANRLKYDEVSVISTAADFAQYIDAFNEHAAATGGDAILFCTYTAMRKLRSYYSGALSGLDDV